MKTLIFLISLISFNAHATVALVGDYQKTKGNAECPEGEIQFLIQEEDKERVVLFGVRKSWTLTLEDKAQTSEKVEEGCTYDSIYDFKDSELKMTTTRSGCPVESENGVIFDELKLVKNELTYYSSFKAKDKEIKQFCRYTKKSSKK